MLVGTPVSVVGSRFWYQDEISDGLVGVRMVSNIKILIFMMRDTFTVVALLPLTQNGCRKGVGYQNYHFCHA